MIDLNSAVQAYVHDFPEREILEGVQTQQHIAVQVSLLPPTIRPNCPQAQPPACKLFSFMELRPVNCGDNVNSAIQLLSSTVGLRSLGWSLQKKFI
jgi:hypothetical protein